MRPWCPRRRSRARHGSGWTMPARMRRDHGASRFAAVARSRVAGLRSRQNGASVAVRNVDSAGDGLSERVDRLRLGNEIRILNPDSLAREAYGGVMKNLDRRRRAFRFYVRRMNPNIARRLKGRKHVRACEQFPGLSHPVLAERGLQAVHDWAVQPETDVGEVLAVLSIATIVKEGSRSWWLSYL